MKKKIKIIYECERYLTDYELKNYNDSSKDKNERCCRRTRNQVQNTLMHVLEDYNPTTVNIEVYNE